jgi:DNA methylase/ParB-like nuclease domain
MQPQPVLLPIDAVHTDGGTQIRTELNQFLIDDYAAAVQAGAVFPPVVVFSDGTDYWLADGFHRLEARRRAGFTEISADLREGTRRDAVLFAVGANVSHGLRRSNSDKRRAVLVLLEDEQWRCWSDREIARIAVVSHEFVRTLRARSSVNNCQIGERTVRRGATTYSMSTSGIGTTHRLAPEIRDLLRDTPIAEDRGELQRLVRLAPEEQREVASWIAGSSAPTVKQAAKAVEAHRREAQTKEVEGAFTDLVPPGRVVRPGEWWCLGRHRLYCGDTSEEAFFSRLPKAEFAFADPPYNAGVAQWDANFEWKHDWLIERAEVVAVTPGIAALCDFARTTTMPYRWTVASWITNGMTRGELGFGNWIAVLLFSHERLFRGAQDLVRVSIRTSESDATGHRGRKPSELLVWFLNTFTASGDTVIDPFLGSGTSLFAAEATSRSCIGGEINPVFCAEIIARWEAQTGLQAERWDSSCWAAAQVPPRR